MKGYFVLKNDYNIFNRLNCIRSTFDIIMRILCVGELMYYNTQIIHFSELNLYSFKKNDILIYIGKRKRLFYQENDSVYSFYFPFEIVNIDNMYRLSLNNKNKDLQKEINILLAILKQIINDNCNTESKCQKMIEEYFQDNYLELDSDFFDNCMDIIDLLYNVDYGYLRYDHDLSGIKGHPVNHIDIYYDDIVGIKLALNRNKKFSINDMINICNIYTDDIDVGYEITSMN